MPKKKGLEKKKIKNMLASGVSVIFTSSFYWGYFENLFRSAEATATCKQLRRHVDRGPYDTAGHHGFRLAEPQVCDLAMVVLVQLQHGRKKFFLLQWTRY
jgi:hypothetical protein